MKNNVKKWSWLIVCLGIIAIVCIGYAGGYRIGSFGIGKIARVEISIPTIGTDVFVDQSTHIITSKVNESVHFDVAPSTHQIIVAGKSQYPWMKNITPASGEKITINPLLVSQNTSGVMITNRDPEYTSLRNQILNGKLPTKDSSGDLSSPSDGWCYINNAENKIKVYVDGSWRDWLTW